MGGKKSQVMLFVILGIVLLFVFALLFSFINSLREEGIAKQEDKAESNLKLKRQFKTFVDSCLENSAKEAVFLVGRQGGVIYDYQAKDTADYRGPPKKPYGEYVLPYEDYTENILYNISYGIEKPRFGPRHPAPPLYPYGPTKLISDPTVLDPAYVNVFGNFPQPGPFNPLCDYNGRNGPGVASVAHSCESYDSRNDFIHSSTQEYMEQYVTNSTIECVKQNVFKTLNSTVNVSGVNTSIMFSNERIYFDMNFPASIRTADRVINTDFQKFSVVLENRLKLIHELATHLIERDVQDIFFDIVRDANTVKDCRNWGREGKLCLKEKMSVKKIRNPCKKTDKVECTGGANYDDLLVIKDEESYLFGEPYEFYFAIENRPPALDLIYQQEGRIGFEYDFVTFVGEELKIEPKAYDPDESFHEGQRFMVKGYDYGMWKEDYDEVYNMFYCNLHPQDCIDNPFGSATKKITSRQPANWTKSPSFRETKRKANYITKKSDWGGHVLKVIACDDEGLCDHQKVRVFVGNLFANQSFNPYSDISNNYTSIEDPYTLVFPAVDLPTSPAKYEFQVKKPSGEITLNLNQTEEFVNIPDVDSVDGMTPDEVKSQVEDVFAVIGTHGVNFRSFNPRDEVLFDSGLKELEVKQCLPHRSSEPPYPFTINNYWHADHACCLGEPSNPQAADWGTFADSSTTCYSEEQTGCFSNFSVPAQVNYNLPSPPVGSSADDMYRFELEVKCSGDEGVSCTGDATGSVTKIEECGVCQKCAAGESGCVAVGTNSYFCDFSFKCSPGEFGDYGAGGKYACQGGCGNTGQCDSAMNCSCDATNCNAECEKRWYKWEDHVCQYYCGGDCLYHGNINTVCAAPSSPTHSVDTGSGPSALVGHEGVGELIQKDTAADNNFYGSVCVQNNKCHVSSCYENGSYELSMEDCFPPATRKGRMCYVSPGPTCDLDGNCTSVEELPFNNNPDGNKCHYNISCNETGWNFDIDMNPGSGAFTDSTNSICYYGVPSCDNTTGWVKQADSTKPGPYAVGNSCHYGVLCTNSGWDLTQTDHNPTTPCNPPNSTQCTTSGWQCLP